NHSQHVSVAGLECQTCHGPVEEMEVMRQHSPLTMGWCVECHRETEVDLSNEYYKEIHEELAKKYGVEKLTIGQLGGLECAKCHYKLIIKEANLSIYNNGIKQKILEKC